MLKRQDRQQEIVAKLRGARTLSIGGLARELHVSDETVRRELRELEAEGLVVRLHGGVRLAGSDREGPLDKRLHEQFEQKQRIARAAAAFVADGDTVFIDAGTTTYYVARELAQRRDLTIVTNALGVATTLGGINGNRLFLCGGQMDPDYRAFSDRQAQDYAAGFTPHLAILSVGAISVDRGLMDYHAGEAAMSRIAYATAQRVLLAADSSKFARYGLMHTAGFADVDVLVTDAPLDDAFVRAFDHAQVVVAADGER